MLFSNTGNNSAIRINGPHRETVTGKFDQNQINYSRDSEKVPLAPESNNKEDIAKENDSRKEDR